MSKTTLDTKIDMYRFVIAKGVYVQCEVDMNGTGDRVFTQYWVGKDTSEKKIMVLELFYKRCDMQLEAVPTLIGGIRLLLTEEYVWESIDELFNTSEEFYKFAEKFQPELTCELTG